ncbi:MAG: peptidyl-prolyl cis-trans isomerase [Candidatus Zixiibacteriota bacterium]|nr:MAG: peptidyl-prolyl cis-trans isomerase [candidate division Zixibacteria bacterium]
MKFAVLLFAVVLAGLSGCGESSGPDRVVARVGRQEITLRQLQERYGLTAADSGSGQPDVIGLEMAARDWATREVLLQEAKKRGLEQDSLFLARMEALHREMLTTLLLEGHAGPAEVDSAEVIKEYDLHRTEYITTEDQVELAYLMAPDRDTANLARRRLTEGLSLEEILDSYETLTGAELGWVGPGDLNPAVSKTAFGLAPGGVSYPQKQDDDRYLILKCRQRRFQGTIRPVEEVYDEISARLQLRRQSEAEQALRDSLWAAYRPEIRLGLK